MTLAIPVIDHVGLVVADLDASVTCWRALGFQVSDPEPLLATGPDGDARPLGQRSAHIVFENAYVEISSPDPGSGNHLEPYLALGEGVRIVVFATADAEAAQRTYQAAGLPVSPVMAASRHVRAGTQDGLARFLWFRLDDGLWPGVLTAVVEHVAPQLVFHPALASHANGLRRVAAFLTAGEGGALARLPALPGADGVSLRRGGGDGPLRITGMACTDDSGGPERIFAFPS